MFLKKIVKKGICRLYIYESYYERDPKTKNGKVRQRCLQSLGSLEALKKEYPDPVAYFTELCEKRNAEKKKAEAPVLIQIGMDEHMEPEEDNLLNAGYGVLKHVYKELELDRFWSRQTENLKLDYSVDQIFRLLVFGRALYPASKKKTYENRHVFFEQYEGFSLDAVYYALDIIARYSQELQEWIFSHSSKICSRDLSVSYFDCTNYYFDIGISDLDELDENGSPIEVKYRKRGPEKNHRPDPIVEMGLMMDRNGIPIAFDLFPGNESEKLHMRPIVKRIKKDYSAGRIIFVADRGLNTSDNIYYLNGNNRKEKNKMDGYVYGQSVRGADEEFKAWVLRDDYITEPVQEDDETVLFVHKSRIHPRTIHISQTNSDTGKPGKKSVLIDQKQMVYYSAKYAEKQRHDREIMVERARDLIRHPKKYDKVTAAGSAAYVKNLSFNKETGEIVEGTLLLIDEEKIAEEALYDGYYSIVSSELDKSDSELRKIYRGLAKIEETFKISKSDLQSRPVFVQTNPHIDAHFTTCFTALVLMRLIQAKLNLNFPVHKIQEALKKYNCVKLDPQHYMFLYYDEVIRQCEDAFNMNLKNK